MYTGIIHRSQFNWQTHNSVQIQAALHVLQFITRELYSFMHSCFIFTHYATPALRLHAPSLALCVVFVICWRCACFALAILGFLLAVLYLHMPHCFQYASGASELEVKLHQDQPRLGWDHQGQEIYLHLICKRCAKYQSREPARLPTCKYV